MAIGRAGCPVNKHRISVAFGSYMLAINGDPNEDYDRESLQAYMQGREIDVITDVGMGQGSATMWTSDLTQSYVAINSDFKT